MQCCCTWGRIRLILFSVFLNPLRLNPSSRKKDSAVPCDVPMVGIKLSVREVLATVEFGNESACWLVLRKNGKKIFCWLCSFWNKLRKLFRGKIPSVVSDGQPDFSNCGNPHPREERGVSALYHGVRSQYTVDKQCNMIQAFPAESVPR